MMHTSEDLLSIVYASSAAQPYSDEDLALLLTQCRANNARYGLTGMLLYRNGLFLQVLEGPADVLRERMSIIDADLRHTEVRILLRETIDQRQFPEWTMGYEPLSDDQADDVPGFRTTFADLERVQEPSPSLEALRELIQWFRDRATPTR